MQRVLHTS